MSEMLLDRAGRRRSSATMPGFHAGRPPRSKGLRYPADPPKVEEIVAVMRTAGDGAHGRRLRGLVVVLWRAGLRIQEALALAEADLDYRRGAVLVRRGKGGRRREVGMDMWGWEELQPWLELRVGASCRPLVLCAQRPDAWPPVVDRRRPSRAAAYRSRGRCPPTVRPTSAPARSRRRNGSRRRTARRHPAAARPQQPRHHLGLPPRHRQRRDHRHRAHPPRANDPGQHIASALTQPGAAHRALRKWALWRCSASRAMIRGCCRARSSTWRCWMARQLGGMRFPRSM
jgi:integrase